MINLPRLGEVWWAEHPDLGRRPVVVLSRDAAVFARRRAMVAPCTTTIRNLVSEVVLEPADDPITLRSAVNLDSVESLSVGFLTERLGVLSSSRLHEICAALAVATGCD